MPDISILDSDKFELNARRLTVSQSVPGHSWEEAVSLDVHKVESRGCRLQKSRDEGSQLSGHSPSRGELQALSTLTEGREMKIIEAAVRVVH